MYDLKNNEKSSYKIVPDIQGRVISVCKIHSHGRINIPQYVRKELKLRDDDEIYWMRAPDGKFYIVKASELG